MMNLQKGNYISRIWFFSRAGFNMDVLAHLWRQLPAGPWRFDYRFRYYNDDQSHDSTDRKSGYQGTFEGALTEAQAVEKVTEAISMLLKVILVGFSVDEVRVETDEPAAVLHLLGQKKWAHFKPVEVRK